ncbi:Hypothetical predicted protein [Paramuricea clavata]|uniref:Uncharacterized protein n=1 Tax=Paramuricea clavata TaxID=317549 RepID=A0A7D9E9W3_PARCT|nr:Hypothetical predicted protein [Paramuricea clavata]
MTEMPSKKLTGRKFIRRPWIQTVLLSGNLENPVPKKAKARVTWLDLQKNRDGTHSGEITDNVYKINVVFSEEAVVECLEDKAHGHIFKRFTDILGGAVVLTDYKVVPQFSEQEFIILINHFKVMPGYIGPLAYTEEIPDNIRNSKHEKEVKEKLQSLWGKQHANLGNGVADSLPCTTAVVGPLENVQNIDASSQGALSEMNSQDESRNNLSYFAEMADEVLKEQEERADLIELCRNYEPLENSDDLEVQGLLDRIHQAHIKYAPFSAETQSSSGDLETSQAIQMPTSDDLKLAVCSWPTRSHDEVVTSEIDTAGLQSTSLDMNLANLNKADLIELCRNYWPLENTEDLEISDLLEMLHQAHTKCAPFCDSNSHSTDGDNEPHQDVPTLDVTHSETQSQSRHVNDIRTSDVTTSETPSSTQSSNVSPHMLLGQNDTARQVFDLTMSDYSQSCLENRSLYVADASRIGAATGVTNATDVTDVETVTSQTLIDETNCEDLPCSSKHIIDRIMNVTVSQDRSTPVARPTLQLSQTPDRSQEGQKRKKELWKFIGGYWKDKKKKLRK